MEQHRGKSALLLVIFAVMLALLVPGAAWAEEEHKVIHAGGLSGDTLYAIGGDQQKDLISIQHVILSKTGVDFDYREYDTMQEGFEALQKGEIDTLYPMTPYKRDLEPLGLVASDGVYTVSWEIIFTGDYSSQKLDTVAVPGGRLAPFYCTEVFPNSKQVFCKTRLDCLQAVLDGKADSAIFNGFQAENIIQNGSKYRDLCYTVLPTDASMCFALRKDDKELLALINDAIANTAELEKTDYMVKSRAVAIEEATRSALIARYRPVLIMAAIFLLVLAIAFIVVTRQVMLPLREFTRCMEENKRLPERGSKALVQLATTYNNLYDNNFETQRLLLHEADHDGLTGLLNRRSFDKCLMRFDASGEGYLLMVVDLDYFKEINDTYGHAVGDKILQKVAHALTESFRSDDFVCRIGGDEFAVIAIHPEHGLVNVLDKKVQRINAILRNVDDGLPFIGVSSGAALWEEGLTGDDVYKRADSMLYEVKTQDRGNFKFYTGSES
ncbi:MAG: GGDEF domain-containing protein [Coriobacteriales bacterium]|nr:GGDEF domain-containing protein [Coriobacteriales bacterium]